MLRITVELIPGGDLQHPGRRVLCQGDIGNDGTGSHSRGNYQCDFYTPDDVNTVGARWRCWRKVKIKDWPRMQRSAWRLVHEALTKALGLREAEAKRKAEFIAARSAYHIREGNV